MANVTGGQSRSPGRHYASNLRVTKLYWLAFLAAACREHCGLLRGSLVERKNAPFKVVFKGLRVCLLQLPPPPALR